MNKILIYSLMRSTRLAVKKIFTDEGKSGITKDREGLSQALLAVAEGNNILVVWKLGRLERSLGFLCDLIKERTKAGMKAAKKRGKHVGRPRALSNGQIQHMHELLNGGKTEAEDGELLGFFLLILLDGN